MFLVDYFKTTDIRYWLAVAFFCFMVGINMYASDREHKALDNYENKSKKISDMTKDEFIQMLKEEI